MDHFIVSARKYRPETFASVVGQSTISATLKNAIKSSHLGHAYLFCGPRGVGKTTCARIFAKTINCSNLTPDTEPCNQCESCKAFNESRSYNIHELDAASNNSVDDIRLLTEKVRIPPQIGKYSVYIIDEVHMLSLAAFNSFLKTLEEPPHHAVFILATTEKHKIIPTILSRCQIFDFARIKVDDTVAYLASIAQKEEIAFEKEALHVIAQKADGAMRDALSIFDQVVSFSGESISYQSVIENLNVLDSEYYFKMCDHLLASDVTASLLILDEIISKGFEPHQFINGLASHFRDLLVSTDPATVKLLEVSEAFKDHYLRQAAMCNPNFLFRAIETCSQADNAYRTSRNQRLLIELALIKICSFQDQKKNSLSDPGPAEVLANPQPLTSAQESAPVAKGVKEATVGRIKTLAQEAEDKEPPKNQVRSTVISIKNALNNQHDVIVTKDDEKEAPDPENDRDTERVDEPFGQEMLLEKWKQFAESVKVERPRMYHTLSNKKPLISEGYLIRVPMDNAAQLEDFNLSAKTDLAVFLRKELSNAQIQIQCFLEETDNGRKKVYTSEDKFQFLNRKNPNLGKLKQQFNLDFE
jgi:DNA polymerase-3 subunit gamma/tau